MSAEWVLCCISASIFTMWYWA